MRAAVITSLVTTLYGCVLLPFGLWFTYRTLLAVGVKYRSLQSSKRARRSSNTAIDVRTQSKRNAQCTLILTGITSVFLILGQLINVIWTALITKIMQRTGENNVWEVTGTRLPFIVLSFVYTCCYTAAYVGILLVCFLRLVQTFDRTQQYRLSYWEIRGGYYSLCLLVLLNVAMIVCYWTTNTWIAISMLIGVLTVYTLFSIWVSLSFFTKTWQLSKSLSVNEVSTQITTQSSADASNGRCLSTTSQKLSKKGLELMDASLRIALLADLSLMSSVIGMISIISSISSRQSGVFFIGICLHQSDYALNGLCLMMTLSPNITHYRSVFGLIHNYLWVRLGFEL